jgi:BirA family transcriptional regulator, biotin operon repressor / biotin---[acetyl-CoA-carboxylase] ligase
MIRADAPVVVFDEIDSTNEEARRRANAGDFEPAWLLAKRQTAGRGRRGRSWTTLPGNMFLTYYGVGAKAPGDLALLGFAAGIGLVEACAPHVDTGVAQLKWPNDLLLNGRKAAGILLESAPLSPSDGRFWLALGVGLNIAGSPDDAGQPTAALKDFSANPPSPLALARTFSEHCAHWSATLDRDGFAPLRTAWERYARGMGDTVSVDLGGTRIEGRAKGLSERGELILVLASGETRLISAGDVYFPAPA